MRTEPFDPPADDRDHRPSARPRVSRSRALSFVPIPEAGGVESPAPAPAPPARLRFVPMDTLDDPAPDAEATVIPLRTAGWSERVQRPGGRTRAAIGLVVVATPAPVEAEPGAPVADALPGRPRRTRLVVVGTVTLLIVLSSTALLRHLVERRTGATVPPAVMSPARVGAMAHPTATATAPPQPAPGASPSAPPGPPVAAAPPPAPAPSTPRATPAPAPRPTPAPTPRRSPAPTAAPAPAPAPRASSEFAGSTGTSDACPGGAVEFGGCTYAVTAADGGTLSAVVSGYASSSLKLKIRDAAGHTLATRLVQPGQASVSVTVGPGTYRVTVQELASRISSFVLGVSLS